MVERAAVKRYKCGVDIGGTFTDFVLIDAKDAQIYVDKCLTTPSEPSLGALKGLTKLLGDHGIDSKEVAVIIHATTLMTNALIERKGAKTGLITTKGFRDVLEIGRENRYDLYDLFLEMPKPLVPRHLRKEVPERITSEGTVNQAFDTDALRTITEELVGKQVEAIAICFLHSYVNPSHEIAAGQLLSREYPQMFVSLSCEVAREIREYERTSTTVANAYVQPLAEKYLAHLEEQLAAIGFQGNLYIMLSSGGISTTRTAKRFPVRLVESGPAAGALVGGFYGTLAGQDHVIAFDMGGTTAKMCLVDEGQPLTSYSFEVARVHRFKKGSGLPIKAPTIELIEIGAGGGSIAWIDGMGLLKVGPQSAGASPGPACYGLGGRDATVTDADLFLGYLNPDYFLGGEMKLDAERARESIHRQVTVSLELDDVQAAWGIHDIVNENMATAARIHIAEKGRDPRRYVLVATGGAGPVHAYRVAKKLQIERIVCPLRAGVASAIGLLVAPPKLEFVHSYVTRLRDLDWRKLNEIFEEMESEGRSILQEAGVIETQVHLSRMADMRYVGQGHEIVVPVPPGRLSADCLKDLEDSFHLVYQDCYGRSTKDVLVEALNWRLVALGPQPEIRFIDERTSPMGNGEGSCLKGKRKVFFPESNGFSNVNVYDRYRLSPGARLTGPAIVEEKESTVVVGPNADFQVDRFQNLIIDLKQRNGPP